MSDLNVDFPGTMNNPPANEHSETSSTGTIRAFLLAIFLIGLLGTGAELLLLEHTEDFWQLIPLLLMVLSLIVLGWRAVDRRPAGLRAFQGTMTLFVAGGTP